MGIIDFREIVSPNATHSSTKLADLGKSNLTDDFEIFCQDFFTQVRKARIFKSVARGPDLGIDLGVEETAADGAKTRWLVSCKHKAHSGASVSDQEERNIIERVGNWGCDGFIPFYTTSPSQSVSGHIDGVEKLGRKVERYFKDRIERELLSSPEGVRMAARYFSKSMVNHYSRIVETADAYGDDDFSIQGNVIYGPRGLMRWASGESDEELETRKSDLKRLANVLATMDMHAPYFAKALNDAIALAPTLFEVVSPPTMLKDFTNVKPTWSAKDLAVAARDNGFARMYFGAAVWSFWDWDLANSAFARAMAVRAYNLTGLSEEEIEERLTTDELKSYIDYKKSIGLLTPGLVAIKLQETARDILARLVAFACPIPS